MKQRLLVAVSAHADDAELNAGGLMAKWVAGGGQVAIVMTTNNCSGEFLQGHRLVRHLPAMTTVLRHREQDAAAAILGAKVYHLGWSQRHYWNGRQVVSLEHRARRRPPPGVAAQPLVIAFRQAAAVKRMRTLLLRLQPARVVTQIPTDLDPEHHATACLVWQALAGTRVPLQYWTPGSSCVDGIFDPGYDCLEDISDYFDMKERLCACHASQMTQVRWDMVRSRARLWGRRIGVRYAEPFKTANSV
ncbi:MAG: Mycothiol S-conjugate amidase [Verrucomicrobiae bacterium]|nr:Mycothiol S-conjugate amidase [Verrucomicrobiae bacterium]